MEIVFDESHVGKRLDKVLNETFEQYSRSKIQKLINDGSVTINEKVVKSNYVIRPGDTMLFVEKEKVAIKDDTERPLPTLIEETEDYLVFNKPAGLTVHRAEHYTGSTFVDFLIPQYPFISKVGDDPDRPGIVHRLDKAASGAMVVAKNQESFESLKKQFKLRQVKKQYLILVYGTIIPREGEIRSFLTRSKQHFARFAANAKGEGREAITKYWTEKSYIKYSLIKVEPATGRTHQIRVHFFSRGYPLVGDPVYTNPKIKKNIFPRLMLHATFLAFHDLSGVLREYTCPPGEDFTQVVEGLKE